MGILVARYVLVGSCSKDVEDKSVQVLREIGSHPAFKTARVIRAALNELTRVGPLRPDSNRGAIPAPQTLFT
jgi:hypothetical protein